MVRSFLKYQGARIGFDPDNVLTFMIALPEQKYNQSSQMRMFFHETEQRLKTMPAVERVGMVSTLPLIGAGEMSSYQIQGKTQLRPEPHSYFALASSDYFQALGIDLLRGRVFQDSDTEASPLVSIIDEKAAKMYFGTEDPIGQHLSIDNDPATKQPRWRQIVGVVAAVKHNANLGDDPKGQLYVPYSQQDGARMMMFAIRTHGNPNAIVSAVRAKVREVDSQQPIFEVATMEKLRDENLSAPRFNTVLLALFGGLALSLAAVGIYGVLSYTVTQRTHEIGLRMALGASQSSILAMVLRHALKLVSIGLLIGVVAALLETRVLASMLFHISRNDPFTYSAIIVMLAAVALLASYAPVLRATKVDPMVALRNE
jgi:predicted permease